ncbi:MAG: VWA domain-containing protein [Candidatus Lokiarchaeota archaeon]|nr:VWA domain-containing protein [Candidatus Lokiarchaeota archaeon]
MTKQNTTTLFLTGFLTLLIFSSIIFNRIAENQRNLDFKGLSVSAPGPVVDSSSGNFRADTWDTTYVTQTAVRNYLEVLEYAYDILVGGWNLPDPMLGSGQPPIEVTVENVVNDYNGWACCLNIDDDFSTGVYPDYINQGLTADHEPLKIAGHELFHICQLAHPGFFTCKWVLEGQARMIQDKLSEWLDHNDGTERGASFVGQSQEYLGGAHKSDLTTISYSACLFWQYYCEQFGSDYTDPDYGVDAISTYWSSSVNPSASDGVTMLNNAFNSLSPGTTFEDVFEDFSVAIYAKDLDETTTPSKWRFVDDDETDGSGNYGTVSRSIDPVPTLKPGLSYINNGFAHSWSNRYYEIKIDPSVKVITVDFNQSTTNKLFYALLCMNGDDLEYSYTVESQDFTRAIVNNNYDKVVVIVAGLENTASSTAYYDYTFDSGDPDIYIKSPQNSPVNAQARVGLHDTPEKFVAIVDVYHQEQAPVHGFFTENFQAQVGGSIATVLAAVDVYGKYFLQIQAPNQTVDGLYDLSVDLIDSDSNVLDSDTEVDSVNYGENYYDIMLNIDNSGSMSISDKIFAAQSASKLLVDSFLSEDQLGIIQFDTDALLIHDLMKLTPGNRILAYGKIDGIPATGLSTSIGDGLYESQEEFLNNGITYYPDHIILLSDGHENNIRWISDVLPYITGNGTIVHVITIGDDAAYEDMQDLAADTGGTYFHCFDPANGDLPNDLAEIYRAISESVRPMERFYQAQGTIDPGNYTEFELKVTDDMETIEIVVHYNSLIKPEKLEYEGVDGESLVWTYEEDTSGMGRALGRINNPTPGVYTVGIKAGSSPLTGEGELKYFVESAAKTYMTMTLLTPPNGYVSPSWSNCEPIGSQIPFLVSLADKTTVKNAEVYLEVIPPGYKSDGILFQIPLYDDGNHGDGMPQDGIYGNVYTPTSEEGSYQFSIYAMGLSNMGQRFSRIQTGAFYIYQNEWIREEDKHYQIPAVIDTDGDGLPNHWEKIYGLDPFNATGIHGASGDPDSDLLSNELEFFHGTNPYNPDTDSGGQVDGSEVYNDSNPLDPADDKVPKFPPIQVLPGNNSVHIILPNATTVPYDYARILRSTNLKSNFDSLILSTYATVENFFDINVSNYQTYYYRVLGWNFTTNSVSISNTYEVIPKLNVLAPEACVIINNGRTTTKTNLVTVNVKVSQNDGCTEIANMPTHMRIGQNASTALNSPWIPFNPQFPVIFDNKSGVKFVFVQLRDNQIIPEVSPLFSAGIYYTGEESTSIGMGTTFTLFMITVDFFVITIMVYRKKRKNLKILKAQ